MPDCRLRTVAAVLKSCSAAFTSLCTCIYSSRAGLVGGPHPGWSVTAIATWLDACFSVTNLLDTATGGRTGNISVPSDASTNATFFMDSDDGSMLYIDGKLLVNHTGVILTTLGPRSCIFVERSPSAALRPRSDYGRGLPTSHVLASFLP